MESSMPLHTFRPSPKRTRYLPPTQRTQTRRLSILFISMFLNILTIGLLGIMFSPLLTEPLSLQAKQRQESIHVTLSTPSPSPTPTPSPMPSLAPMLQPVKPFPSTLNAQ